jgi:hypothetical protein
MSIIYWAVLVASALFAVASYMSYRAVRQIGDINWASLTIMSDDDFFDMLDEEEYNNGFNSTV